MAKIKYEHWVMKEISQRFYFTYDKNDKVVYDEKRIRAEVEEILKEKLGQKVFEKDVRIPRTRKMVSTLYRKLRQHVRHTLHW